ncbi:ABC transporter ATP-binding protein [Candidatus Aerophobetes bacterium]|uniref:ABC transporter ATP-binding protein n=1 Tax=Aerophobetes bacterium TaxID=2030807 RepID=A0A662DC89_UNCAE|nr:MAG: ABC transporter ATP-binding protein [Candidatus Aerophobetes bacterium]
MLKVEKINTFYGEAHILFDVSIEVNKGETVCLLGRNGVGKTTTLKSIIGLAPPRSGKIYFRGEDITGLPSYIVANKDIGFVPEDRRIFPNLTVRRNLEVGRRKNVKGGWDIDTIYQHFPKLKELDSHYGETLSGGELQMLAIARTLMGNPELLLLDEPCEGLAPLIVEEVINIIRSLKEKELSILWVEQYSAKALEESDRCYVMDKGRIVYEGYAKELSENVELKKKLLAI